MSRFRILAVTLLLADALLPFRHDRKQPSHQLVCTGIAIYAIYKWKMYWCGDTVLHFQIFFTVTTTTTTATTRHIQKRAKSCGTPDCRTTSTLLVPQWWMESLYTQCLGIGARDDGSQWQHDCTLGWWTFDVFILSCMDARFAFLHACAIHCVSIEYSHVCTRSSRHADGWVGKDEYRQRKRPTKCREEISLCLFVGYFSTQRYPMVCHTTLSLRGGQ
mmetsp:Transcript_13464/g.25642  ORF Transcript_13464/g.25642 Transcript_13464/m.25642 type:complete len:218 (+) Transcript_13464:757-1410(+)